METYFVGKQCIIKQTQEECVITGVDNGTLRLKFLLLDKRGELEWYDYRLISIKIYAHT